jgi:hypothetical protein
MQAVINHSAHCIRKGSQFIPVTVHLLHHNNKEGNTNISGLQYVHAMVAGSSSMVFTHVVLANNKRRLKRSGSSDIAHAV